MKEVKHPCINCVYFKTCGETTRTVQCSGRVTRKEQKEKKRAT